jgi:hypothetical protein
MTILAQAFLVLAVVGFIAFLLWEWRHNRDDCVECRRRDGQPFVFLYPRRSHKTRPEEWRVRR